MKKIILIRTLAMATLLSVSVTIIAQDIIYTKDGREIQVKVEEVDGSSIKYKAYEEADSPLRTFDVQYVDFIKYENGTIERFVKTESSPSKSESSEDVSLNYLKIEYEKSLARQKFSLNLSKISEYSTYTSTVLFGIAAISTLVADNPDYTVFQISGIMIGVSLAGWAIGNTAYKISSRRVQYYEDRIDNLSFIIIPNNQPFLSNNGNIYDNYSVGLRYTF